MKFVDLGPAVAPLILVDRRDKKDSIFSLVSSNVARRAAWDLAEKDGHDGPREWIITPAAKLSPT